MTAYANGGDNANINTDIGSPTLGASDIVNVVEGDVDYNDSLSSLGTTAFAEFNTAPGYKGNLGDYPDGLLVKADTIRLEDGGRRHALKGEGTHTVDVLVNKCLRAPELMFSTYTAVTLALMLAAGKSTWQDSVVVTTLRVGVGGHTAVLKAGAAASTLVEAGCESGTARAIIERDATTVTVNKNGIAEAREDCSPTTVNCDGGTYKHQSTGAIGTINAGAGAVIDFSEAKGDSSSITWNISGNITIIEPAAAVSIDMPTTLEEGEYAVTYKKRA